MTNTDCIADSFEPEVAEGNKRNLTVSYASRHPDYQRIPAVVMKGQWLEAAGFATGTKVEVRVMKGCMVLIVCETEANEIELNSSMRIASKLSIRKQKMIQDFIDILAKRKSKTI